MALNEVGYNGKVYGDEDIEEATGYRKSVVVGDELPYDTFEAKVWDYANALLMLADSGPSFGMINADGRAMVTRFSADEMTNFTYGAPVSWTHRGKLVLKQFLESVRRTGEYKYLLSCVSGIGLISKSRHYGGMYTNVPLSTVLSDIIGGAFPYTVDADVGAYAVYGWLPVSDRRNNLRVLLTAYGVLVKANPDGSVRFSAPDLTAPISWGDDTLYMGGSVDHRTPYRAVKITEHAYAETPNDILTTLLDGAANGEAIITPKGASVTGAIITFDDPMHGLEITGSTIIESGVNYAVLAPSAYCTLTGLKYSHTTRVVTAGDLSAGEQATKRLDDCTLVNLFNVDLVAQRWLKYFSAQKEIQVTNVWADGQTGDAVLFSDPYDEQAVGIIESQDVRMSAKLAADTIVQAGPIPAASGNLYTHVMVVTQSGDVTIPAEAKGKARLVLISGGTGGSSGESGEDGGRGETSPGRGGSGGTGGTFGEGGRVLVITVDVSPGQILSGVVIGAGGKGGVLGADGASTPGQLGSDTIVGEYTTKNAYGMPNGYFDILNGELYAGDGTPGINGGSGGNGSSSSEPSPPGESVGSHKGGAGGFGPHGTSGGNPFFVSGGAGGGASADEDGGNGSDGEWNWNAGEPFAQPGDGGRGGNAIKPETPTTRGRGGRGGNGGGGGGGAGGSRGGVHTWPGNGGPGGKGADGGDGADGVLLIYY